jgi:hypothetical protein
MKYCRWSVVSSILAVSLAYHTVSAEFVSSDSGIDAESQDNDGGAADDIDVGDFPICEDTLAYSFSIQNIDPPQRDSNNYSPPPPTAEKLLLESINALLDDYDAIAARSIVELPNAANLDYILCRDPDDPTVARWEPRVEGTGTARFALRLGEARNIIIGVPHGRYERYTMTQGVELFENLVARALIVNGAHRCTNTSYGGTKGQTSVCGKWEFYRDSDLAHAKNSIFQWVHEILIDRYYNDWVISIHGKSGSGIHVSNGTTCAIGETTPSAMLVLEMEKDAILRTEGIKSCNLFPGVRKTTGELCGTSNVQGRYLNGYNNNCKTAADRFIHIEQPINIRSRYRPRIQSALEAVVP